MNSYRAIPIDKEINRRKLAQYTGNKMKPLICNSFSVKAILDRRQSQTRRIIMPQPKYETLETEALPGETAIIDGVLWKCSQYSKNQSDAIKWRIAKPKYKVGDKLYCKESYQILRFSGARVKGIYLADNAIFNITLTPAELQRWHNRKRPYMKTSGRFMYKSLARIFLKITDIRGERVKSMSFEDVYAEGIKKPDVCECCTGISNDQLARNRFADLWDSIYGKDAWERNDWALVIVFKYVQENEE